MVRVCSHSEIAERIEQTNYLLEDWSGGDSSVAIYRVGGAIELQPLEDLMAALVGGTEGVTVGWIDGDSGLAEIRYEVQG